MWPTVNLETGDIDNMNYITVRINNNKCNDANIVIKEIVMIYADADLITFNEDEVPLVVTYDTDYGWHTILFSLVTNLQTNDNSFTSIFTSAKESKNYYAQSGVPEEILTKIFHKMMEIKVEPVTF